MQFRKTLLAAALGMTLTACGSSSDNSAQQPERVNVSNGSQGVTALPATVIGTISAATSNSITVNRHALTTTNANITYQGQPVNAAVLVLGMPVTVYSTNNQVIEIAIDPDAAGEVTAVTSDSITVAGTTYAYAANNVAVGDYVFLVLDEQKSVSRLIGSDAGSAPLWTEIEGFITHFDAVNQQLIVNGISIDYRGALIKDGQLSANSYVEVIGTYANGIFTATEIDIEHDNNDGEVEVGGIITWVNESQRAFELSNLYTFEILATTRIEDGQASDLRVGDYAEATTVNGQLTELDLERAGTNTSTNTPVGNGTVTGSNVPNKFSVSGVMDYRDGALSFNGFPFVIDSRTRFDDQLTLETLSGEALELEGVVRNGSFIIREIERMEQDNELDIEGRVTNGTLWGYSIADASLTAYEGQWLDLECYFDGNSISNCAIDD